MEYNAEKKEIILKRKLNKLDKFVIDFISILEKYADYVIISGYVSILLGRSRATEDVDLLIPKIDKQTFDKIWEDLHINNFECVNAVKAENAFETLNKNAIRFCIKRKFIPNIELKFIKNDLDRYSFEERIKVLLNEGFLHISPIELQIAYKLFLGSEKDIEDAKHMYELFKEKINKEKLLYFVGLLKAEIAFETLIKNEKDESRFKAAED